MNELLKGLQERRSCRSYKPDPVPKELLDQILTAGSYAATGMGRQSPIMIAVTDPALRDRLRRRSAMSHYNAGNVLSMHALIAAYDRAEGWAEEMIRTVDGNIRCACDFIEAHFPGVRVMRAEGTYMLCLDCADWLRAHGDTLDALLRRGAEVGVLWQNGEDFLYPDSIRLNLALPRSLLEEALRRLQTYVFL